jgi:hypothetical protein
LLARASHTAGQRAQYAIHPDSLTGPGAMIVAAFGWWVGKKLDDAAYRRRLRAHERRVQEYEAAVAAWRQQMDAERAELLNRYVDSALVVEQRRADSLRASLWAENERIRRRNAAKPAPTVTVERMP